MWGIHCTLPLHASSLLAGIKLKYVEVLFLRVVRMDAKFYLLHLGIINVLLRVFMVMVLRNILVLDSFAKLRKTDITFGVSVRPSALNNSALKFDI